MIKKHQVQKFTQLPTGENLRPLMVVVDEATSLLQAEPVPKGLPKDSPLLGEIGERNMLRATALNLMSKIPRELRFAGVSLVLASQVASSTVGIPTELRANLPGKVLLGAKPTDGNRRLALANHDHVPMVPPYLAETSGGIARGVGVFEFEGKTPGVFKGYFNQPSRLASWLLAQGLPTCSDPTPRPTQMAKNVPSLGLVDDDYDPQLRSSSRGGGNGRRRDGPPLRYAPSE